MSNPTILKCCFHSQLVSLALVDDQGKYAENTHMGDILLDGSNNSPVQFKLIPDVIKEQHFLDEMGRHTILPPNTLEQTVFNCDDQI